MIWEKIHHKKTYQEIFRNLLKQQKKIWESNWESEEENESYKNELPRLNLNKETSALNVSVLHNYKFKWCIMVILMQLSTEKNFTLEKTWKKISTDKLNFRQVMFLYII